MRHDCRSHTNSIPTAINDIIAVLDPDNNQNLNTVLVTRFSSKGYFQYTISFLSTGRNHNSTLIIGDSNTYNIKFQSERKWSTLGK